jgi:Aspartyl protease
MGLAMRVAKFGTLLLPLALIAAAAPAWADDCTKPPLRIVDSLPLTPAGPQDPRFTIPVSINGTEVPFLFDTGGALPSISQRVVDDLKLRTRQSDTQLYGVGGKRSDNYAVVAFEMGKIVRASDAQIMVSPGISILTPVFMNRFDIDFDIANHKLNILSSDHCPGKVIYWPAKAATAVSYNIRNKHIMVPVTVDGHDFVAVIDTGAATSVMNMDIAVHVFELSPDSPGMQAIGHLAGDENNVVYHYPFKKLSFGDINVTNPKIAILPDVVGKNADKRLGYFGGHISKPEDLTLQPIIIGMDVLSKLHVYFAQDEHKLYITEAGAPASPTP